MEGINLTTIMFDIMFVSFFIAMFIVPKYGMGWRIEQGIIRMTRPKTVLPTKRKMKYLVPLRCDTYIADMLQMGKVWRPLKYYTAAFAALMWVTQSLCAVLLENVNPYVFIAISYTYWVSLLILIVVDIIFSMQITYLLGLNGVWFILALVPPLSGVLMSTKILKYFKENKDSFSGAFEGRSQP